MDNFAIKYTSRTQAKRVIDRMNCLGFNNNGCTIRYYSDSFGLYTRKYEDYGNALWIWEDCGKYQPLGGETELFYDDLFDDNIILKMRNCLL